MNAVVVEEYGGIDQLVHKRVPKPSAPEGHDILVQYNCLIDIAVQTYTKAST